MSTRYYPIPLKNGKTLELPSVNTCLPPPPYMRFSDNGTWVGTQAHAMIARIIKGEVISKKEWDTTHPEVKQSVRAFMRFLQQSKCKPLQSEVMVYSLEYGYAGTLDAVLLYRRRNSIGDFKTGDANTEATAMKLAAYDHAWGEMHPSLKPGPTFHIKISKLSGVATWIQYQRKEVEKYFELFIQEKNKVIEWTGNIERSMVKL